MTSYNYGSGGGMNDRLGRVESIRDGGTILAEYTYLGLDRRVIVDYKSQPGIQMRYKKLTAESNGDAGDAYIGLDRFGLAVDVRWVKGTTDVERVKYGFDRASNRMWRENPVAGTGQDEYYTYDGLDRRASKVVSGTTRHFYYSDQWQIVEERTGSSTCAERRFVWGLRYVDDLILRDRLSGGSSSSSSSSSCPNLDERLYVLHDYFNVTAVTNSSGTVLERYGYNAFGLSRVMTAARKSSATAAWPPPSVAFASPSPG